MSDKDAGRSAAGRSRRRRLEAATIVALSLTIIAAPLASAADAQNAVAPQAVGQAPAAPRGAVAANAPSSDTALHLSVSLAPRDQAALDSFAAAVSNPNSPQYKHYLGKGEFGAKFGPTQQTIDSVTRALRNAGLNPGAATPDGLTIPVDTTVAQARSAFGVDFAGYKLTDGRSTYGNTSAPKLPANVASSVRGVLGLNDFLRATPKHTPAKKVGAVKPGTVQPNTVHPNTATPSVCANVRQLAAQQGWSDGQQYWEPGSLSASNVYNTGQLYTQYGDNGNGVTVALFELENYNSADITSYQQCFGTNVSVNAIPVAPGPTGQPTGGEGAESALDIETVLGVAPGSSINVYQNYENATDAEVLATYQRMVTDDSAQVISTSWGLCELDLHTSDPGYMAQEAMVFQEAATQGQSVFASSGDSGSTGCYQNPNSGNGSKLVADDPAVQQWVTSVGGTWMQGSLSNEHVWNTPGAELQNGRGLASGGGVSAYVTMSGATNYQQGVTGPGYSNACSATAPATCRQVPDVAALGDLDTGYLVAYDHTSAGDQYWNIIGGTSLSAPLWGAIAALADSSHPCAATGPVGFVNPALYQNHSSLFDITQGNNDVATSGYTGGLYAAGPGYDLATGWGVPMAPQTVENLCDAKPGTAGSTFQPLPPTRLLDTRASGGKIGPFSSISLPVTGSNGIPGDGSVTAVVLNVTATNPTDSSFMTVYPHGKQVPSSSNLNYVPNQTVPNLVTVPVGAGGAVDFYNHTGSVDAVVDVFGYYTTNTGSTYHPVTPSRALDTRNGNGPIGAFSSLPLQLAGNNAIPASGATAVVLNVTATNPTDSSFLSVYPDGGSVPTSSNLNFTPGQTVPNLVTVPLPSDGKVDIYNHTGTVDVVVDVFGYYTNDNSGLKFHATTPARIADTRTGAGIINNNGTPAGPGAVVQVPLQNTGGAGNNGVLGNSGGLVLNVTATGPTASSFVTVYPSSVTRPSSSNLNFVAGETVPNAVVTPVNGGAINLWNAYGNVDLVVDLFGYFQ